MYVLAIDFGIYLAENSFQFSGARCVELKEELTELLKEECWVSVENHTVTSLIIATLEMFGNHNAFLL